MSGFPKLYAYNKKYSIFFYTSVKSATHLFQWNLMGTFASVVTASFELCKNRKLNSGINSVAGLSEESV